MNTVAIITEYNPFHKGHAYQIAKAKSIYGQDATIVCIMSGPFVQRGEPALMSKWLRAKAALHSGADLVLELPFTFACASAERFALGAVETLNHTGVITDLYFGAECDDLSLLCCLANEYDEENPLYVQTLQHYLKEGHPYAKARELAITSVFENDGRPDLAEAAKRILHLPNSILALEYLIALRKTESPMKPTALLRKGAGYLECDVNAPFASATAIRNTIQAEIRSDRLSPSRLALQLKGKLPDITLAMMLSEWQQGIRPVHPAMLAREQIMRVRTQSLEQLDQYAYMSDRLPGRLKNSVDRLRNIDLLELHDTFRDSVQTRRYASTRINRALIATLIGHMQSDIENLEHPEYIRVLGFSYRGRDVLRHMRRSATLPIIDKASDFLDSGKHANFKRMCELDLNAVEFWNLYAGLPYGHEFEQQVIRLTRKETDNREIMLPGE
ncbi:MAG: nucleotidyltransferase family protein [Clostridiaceae bacterium]|nr:nucleotidyltransferase family protein [Clostridiaceae bacterium]